MKVRRFCFVFLGLAPLPTAAKAPPHVDLKISCSSDGRLDHVAIDGRAIVVRPKLDTDALRAALRSRRTPIHIINSTETPYRCVGGLIFELQHLGYRYIAFISEPPPPEPVRPAL